MASEQVPGSLTAWTWKGILWEQEIRLCILLVIIAYCGPTYGFWTLLIFCLGTNFFFLIFWSSFLLSSLLFFLLFFILKLFMDHELYAKNCDDKQLRHGFCPVELEGSENDSQFFYSFYLYQALCKLSHLILTSTPQAGSITTPNLLIKKWSFREVNDRAQIRQTVRDRAGLQQAAHCQSLGDEALANFCFSGEATHWLVYNNIYHYYYIIILI